MQFYISASLYLLLTVLVNSTAFAQVTPEGNWLVKHTMRNVGADGIARELNFSERVYRRADVVWVERVMPPAAQAAHELTRADEAAASKAHKHLDVTSSSKWITPISANVSASSRQAQLRLVNPHDRVVIAVSAAEHSAVGFDGSWTKAYHLIDPKTLETMKALSAPAADGVQRYESVSKSASNPVTMRVSWDANAKVPRSVESKDKLGLTHNMTTIESIPAPRTLPWQALEGFSKKEYSDYLD